MLLGKYERVQGVTSKRFLAVALTQHTKKLMNIDIIPLVYVAKSSSKSHVSGVLQRIARSLHKHPTERKRKRTKIS